MDEMDDENYEQFTIAEFKETFRKAMETSDDETSKKAYANLYYAWNSLLLCNNEMLNMYSEEITKLRNFSIIALRNGMVPQISNYAQDLLYRLTPAILYNIPKEMADKVYMLSFHIYSLAFLKTCGDASNEEILDKKEQIKEDAEKIDEGTLRRFLTIRSNYHFQQTHNKLYAGDREGSNQEKAEFIATQETKRMTCSRRKQ